ncbi:uncharacterized protein [Nicotiana sylvestris]|uniref:Uncharacterized protein LOC104247146 n=1 Tax=Nicotiana sylvestris TaxID=4096 RepID=A0A1U7YBA6_NICSY|nr:PREDICTED: uncharacterized protein LOC104247146 [Nicotiana sylvestris]
MAKFQICLDLKKFQEYLSSSPIFGFKNLKVLTLGSVDVDNQVVNIFLSSCPLLEQLSIRKSQVLKHLEIGPSLKLKHLEIYECDIHYLEICNVNLVSFYFYGSEKTNLRIENVSSIVNLEIEIYYGSLPRLIDLITTKFTQLVKLPLEVKTSQYEDVDYYFSFPKFNNLKWLILTIDEAIDSSLLNVTPLLQASPYLGMFEFNVYRG